MDLEHYLRIVVERSASDLFLSAGAPPNIKIDGHTHHLGATPLDGEQIRAMAWSVMNAAQREEFEREWEMNLAHAMGDQGRFRINIYRQRGEVAMAVRYLTMRIPGIAELNLPLMLQDLIMAPRGLLLFVGAAGSGKSTTMASMIDYRNRLRTGHILTVEDPIEYLHSHKMSVVDQREVGFDTHSYAAALRNAMREAPDVLMIGEIRDRETMQHAITYAETGHLCLATLHSNNANQTVDRILNFFPEAARQQVLLDLSLNLRAVISLRLVPGLPPKATRVPAVEMLLTTAYVADLILKGDIHSLKLAMANGTGMGMQTFDESLFRLFRDGLISYENAIGLADSRTDLTLRLKLQGLGPDAGPGSVLSIEEPEPEETEPGPQTRAN